MNKKFKILSIDGGGIRGIFPAVYLAEIEAKLKAEGKTNWQIYQNFDLICGTSTGGILAIALSLGIPASEIRDLYFQNAKNIFGNKRNFFKRIFYSAHSNKFLEQLIKGTFSRFFEGVEPRMKDCKKPTFVTTYDLQSGTNSLLKSSYHKSFIKDLHIPAFQAAMATSAAPTYFDPYSNNYEDLNGQTKTFYNKIDGGVFCNNPTLAAIIEAQEVFEKNLEDLIILSLGTGKRLYRDTGCIKYKYLPFWGHTFKRKMWGIVYWMLNKGRKPIIELMMQAQSQQVEGIVEILRHGIGNQQKNRFYHLRINPDMDENTNVDLDEYEYCRLENLKVIAEREFQTHGVNTVKQFFN